MHHTFHTLYAVEGDARRQKMNSLYRGINHVVLCTIFGEGFQQLFTALREDRDQLITSVIIVFYIW